MLRVLSTLWLSVVNITSFIIAIIIITSWVRYPCRKSWAKKAQGAEREADDIRDASRDSVFCKSSVPMRSLVVHKKIKKNTYILANIYLSSPVQFHAQPSPKNNQTTATKSLFTFTTVILVFSTIERKSSLFSFPCFYVLSKAKPEVQLPIKSWVAQYPSEYKIQSILNREVLPEREYRRKRQIFFYPYLQLVIELPDDLKSRANPRERASTRSREVQFVLGSQ